MREGFPTAGAFFSQTVINMDMALVMVLVNGVGGESLSPTLIIVQDSGADGENLNRVLNINLVMALVSGMGGESQANKSQEKIDLILFK